MNEYIEKVKPLIQHWLEIDELSQIILKGQLVLEERLTKIISKFVFHPKLIASANLRFNQKVELARSMSLDESENRM